MPSRTWAASAPLRLGLMLKLRRRLLLRLPASFLRNDLDFILHVGDYIYEYEPGAYGPGPAIGRVHEPMNEIVTLQDYRRRHAQYKTDPDLQALHAAQPFICTWDDHELADD